MSNIQYVIRQNDFAYNDEWHLTNCVSTGAIKQIYTDKAEAEKAYKSLVVEGLYYDELCNYDIGNGEADDEIYEKLEALILEKTGKTFNIDDGEIPKLNEDDAFEFAKISGIVWYQLLEVDASQPCYVLGSTLKKTILVAMKLAALFLAKMKILVMCRGKPIFMRWTMRLKL